MMNIFYRYYSSTKLGKNIKTKFFMDRMKQAKSSSLQREAMPIHTTEDFAYFILSMKNFVFIFFPFHPQVVHLIVVSISGDIYKIPEYRLGLQCCEKWCPVFCIYHRKWKQLSNEQLEDGFNLTNKSPPFPISSSERPKVHVSESNRKVFAPRHMKITATFRYISN